MARLAKFPLQIEIRTLFKDIQVFKGNNEQHVVYELLVTNASIYPVRIVGIRITGKKFKSVITGKNLTNSFSKLSTANTRLPEDPLLQSNQTGVIYLLLDFPDNVPDVLYHKVIIQSPVITRQSIIINPIMLNEIHPIVINPPLRGKKWLADNAVSNASAHRRFILAFNGKLKIPQRTAIDFTQYGPKGLYDGDPLIKENWYAYGHTIYSATDGTVIRTLNNIVDNIPGQLPVDLPTPEILGGNYVLIEMDDSHYAFYAHMIPGSVNVKVGDKVRTGQILGLLGNSGNSTAPHLHFHITNKPLPIGNASVPSVVNAQGIPWHFNKFIRNEYIIIEGPTGGISNNVKVKNQVLVKDQMPMYDELVTFR